ncbi:MAG TPA: histidine kinase dimerization/phospho-acceptor domain-containing protein [Pirellulales bacterium]|nr:histidine kinase dimerization/phospho-acceptor domain-containing protein [Pirellulales bacterium]
MTDDSQILTERLSNAAERAAIVGRLTNRLAHRIRNPLSAITNSAYCVEAGCPELDENGRSHLRRIAEQVNAIERLLRHVAEFADRPTGGRHRFALQTVIGDALAAARLAGLQMHEAALPQEPIETLADSDQFRRAIILLIEVVSRLSRDPASLQLNVRLEGEGAAIQLHASQTGLTPAQAHGLLPAGLARPEAIDDPCLAMAALYAAANGATLEIVSAHTGEITVSLRLPTDEETDKPQ